MRTLSICIPTFKREESIKKIISEFSKKNLNNNIYLIILNDYPGSNLEALNDPNKNIYLFRNKQNIGYARSFIKLFSLSKSDYVLMSSDDDSLDFDQINKIFDFLQKKQFDFVSTVYKTKNKIYRGNTKELSISFYEIRSSSNHAPGLIYKSKSVNSLIHKLSSRIEKGCYISQIYPQVIISYLLKINGGILLWNSLSPINEGANLNSNLTFENGKTYSHPINRIIEFKALDIFFMEEINNDIFDKGIYIMLRLRHKISLFKYMLLPLFRKQSNQSKLKTKENLVFLFSNTKLFFKNYLEVSILFFELFHHKLRLLIKTRKQ